ALAAVHVTHFTRLGFTCLGGGARILAASAGTGQQRSTGSTEVAVARFFRNSPRQLQESSCVQRFALRRSCPLFSVRRRAPLSFMRSSRSSSRVIRPARLPRSR